MPEENKSEEEGVATSTETPKEKPTENEGLLKEIQGIRDKQQVAEERAEMLQEKLDALETAPEPKGNSEEIDEDDFLTVKQAKALTQNAVKEALFTSKVQDIANTLNRSEHKEDFERYLIPLINKRKSLIADLVRAEDPVAEALSVIERNPQYKKEKERDKNFKDTEKIKDNLNKPKNLSEASGIAVGKKSPKDMTPKEVIEEQDRILNQ